MNPNYVLLGLGATASLVVMLGLTPGVPADVPGRVCIADAAAGLITMTDGTRGSVRVLDAARLCDDGAPTCS